MTQDTPLNTIPLTEAQHGHEVPPGPWRHPQ